MGEEWRPVVGYEEYYEISSHGRVKSYCIDPSGRIISGTIDAHGYRTSLMPTATMVGGKGRRRHKHHTMVLEAFIGPNPNDGHSDGCRHLDGDKLNNRVENLMWGTNKENAADRVRHGTSSRGEKNPAVKLNEMQVRIIKRLFRTDIPQAEIARIFGSNDSNICNIKNGHSWSWLQHPNESVP